MPKRTINDAYFNFYNAEGRVVSAQRGETVDIPEGADLDRGEKCGSFTAEVGQEPEALEGSFIPAIEVEWTQEEYNRWVDAGKINEVLDKLNEVAPSQRPQVAERLIEAENGRGQHARSRLLQALARVASSDAGADDIQPEETTEEPEADAKPKARKAKSEG